MKSLKVRGLIDAVLIFRRVYNEVHYRGAMEIYISYSSRHSFVHYQMDPNLTRIYLPMLFRCVIYTIVLLSYSSIVVAGSPSSAANTNAPSAIDWLNPTLKDAATPRTLILCSDQVDEQLRRYRSLIEKISDLKGHEVLDGGKFSGIGQPVGTIGYIVSAHRGNEDQAVKNCVASHPELRAIIADVIEKEIPAQQARFKDLIRFGILPKGTQPFQCFSKPYYSTEGATTWIVRVGIDSSSNDRCFDELLPITFGISPDYCRSSDVCN
ncbi:hypothetical protein J2W92_005178 [Rhizobium leguminosarum]